MVVIDTNIVIDHLRQKSPPDSFLGKILNEIGRGEVTVAMITIQELFGGQSTKDKQIEQAILSIILSLKILPYTYDVAKLAGEIGRDLSHPIEFADAAIAATAIVNGGQLATLNKKDFKGIGDLELFDSK